MKLSMKSLAALKLFMMMLNYIGAVNYLFSGVRKRTLFA